MNIHIKWVVKVVNFKSIGYKSIILGTLLFPVNYIKTGKFNWDIW